MSKAKVGRIAIVTGAAGGIGQAIVRAYLKLDYQVIGVDLSEELLRELSSSVGQDKHLHLIAADLSDSSSWKKVVQFCTESAGPPQILVNNAATIIRQRICDSTIEQWDRQVSVNLRAAYFLSKLCAEEMRRIEWGRIINLSSQAASTGGSADCPIYATTKGGIEAMTRAFAREYARSNITANAIAPGVVRTNMIENTLTPAKIASVIEKIPIGRATEADEIAAAAVYLASEQGGSVTGHVLDITGGMTIR